MLKFELSEDMMRTIGTALENAPYKMAAPVLTELQKQINAQIGMPNDMPSNIAIKSQMENGKAAD